MTQKQDISISVSEPPEANRRRFFRQSCDCRCCCAVGRRAHDSRGPGPYRFQDARLLGY